MEDGWRELGKLGCRAVCIDAQLIAELDEALRLPLSESFDESIDRLLRLGVDEPAVLDRELEIVCAGMRPGRTGSRNRSWPARSRLRSRCRCQGIR